MSVLDGFENKMQMLKDNFCTKLVFEGMEIDVSKRMIYRENKEVKATCVEFQILHLLARNPGRVFSKEQIYDIVWKEPYVGDYNIVMSHIRNIREKIEDDPKIPSIYRYGDMPEKHSASWAYIMLKRRKLSNDGRHR